MSDKQKRLETVLLDFIESAIKEPSSDKEIILLPLMAHELVELWKITG
jgi:hypothetical protein